MIVHPWGIGHTGTPEEISKRIDEIGDLEGGFNDVMRSHLKFLVNINKDKKLKFHVAGHEGHFVMSLEEIPEEIQEKGESNEK